MLRLTLPYIKSGGEFAKDLRIIVVEKTFTHVSKSHAVDFHGEILPNKHI